MKKLIFVNCVLALAVIFTYCSKPDLKEELSTVNTENVAENRAVCVLTNQPTTTFGLVLCGTNTNNNACNACNGAALLGTANVTNFINFPLTTPTVISISAPFGGQNLFLNAGGNNVGPFWLPQGACRRFAIDGNCNITAL